MEITISTTLFVATNGAAKCANHQAPSSMLNNGVNKNSAFLNGSQNNLSELQKSYFKLLEEKNNFKEQLTSKLEENKQLREELTFKEKRINQLENKLNSLMNSPNVKRIDLIDTTTDC